MKHQEVEIIVFLLRRRRDQFVLKLCIKLLRLAIFLKRISAIETQHNINHM